MTSRPRLGLVGFFGWGNFGDELFVKAHQQHLGDIAELAPINDLTSKPYFTRPVDTIVDEHDAFIIGGGDLVIPWQVSELYWKEEYLRKPVYIVGIGVPTWGGLSRNAIERYREFFRSPNVKLVLARDEESAQWINKHIDPHTPAEAYADLVCAMRLPKVTRPTSEKTLGIVLRQRKHSDDLHQVRSLCERAKSLGYTIRHIVLGTKQTGKDDLEVVTSFAQEGEEIVYDEDLDVLCSSIASCSMLASMKFHGTVVACMYGVPSIVMSPTDKNRNFIRMIQRPDLLSSFSSEELPHRLPYYPAPIPSHTRSVLRRRATQAYGRIRQEIAKL